MAIMHLFLTSLGVTETCAILDTLYRKLQNNYARLRIFQVFLVPSLLKVLSPNFHLSANSSLSQHSMTEKYQDNFLAKLIFPQILSLLCRHGNTSEFFFVFSLCFALGCAFDVKKNNKSTSALSNPTVAIKSTTTPPSTVLHYTKSQAVTVAAPELPPACGGGAGRGCESSPSGWHGKDSKGKRRAFLRCASACGASATTPSGTCGHR